MPDEICYHSYNYASKKDLVPYGELVVVSALTYYLVFSKSDTAVPAYTTPTATTQTSNTPTETVPAQTSPVTASVTVHIKDFKFSPAITTIKAGTKVTWINDDSAPHTVTSDSGNLLASPTLAQGQSFSFIFDNPSTEAYHCSIHPMMKGSVVVQL